MFKSYIKIAWRNLIYNKLYSAINIGGLAVGLATALLLLNWVKDEQSYDKFHPDHPLIYRLSSHFNLEGKPMVFEGVPAPLAVFAKSIPEVEKVVRTSIDVDQNLSTADRSKIADGHTTAFVDSTFFSVFDFQLLSGNRNDLFKERQAVVLTKSTAEKFFGSPANAMGKQLNFRGNLFTVKGILADFPKNSSLAYDALFPMAFFADEFAKNGGNGTWKTIDTDIANFNYVSFAKLRKGADVTKVAEALNSAYKDARNGELDVDFRLQKLSDIHLINLEGNDNAAKMVRIFAIVAALILVIAAVNYINLSTARVMSRLKEISVRKIIGAEKRQLFWQFIMENVPLFLIALVFAILLLYLLSPAYESMTGKSVSLSIHNHSLWLSLALIASCTFLGSTIYPALLLSSLQAIKTLKGNFSKIIGKETLRKILVTFQFSISIMLIIATLVIGRQLQYIQQKSLGYNKDYVFTVPLTWDIVTHIEGIKNDLTQTPSIFNVSLSGIYDLTDLKDATSDLEWKGKSANTNVMIGQAVIDDCFIPTMGITFLEGGNFTGTAADSNQYILNEAAVNEMGLTSPYTGQPISYHGKAGYIQGVVHDFHFKSLKEKITPLVLNRQYAGNILYVRTKAGEAEKAISAVKKVHQKYGGDSPFSFRFLDEQFEARYTSDIRASLLFKTFASIAIFISCLGLFGLSTYTVRVRMKEIGIRKVLGASVPSILGLLNKDSIVFVFIGFCIASPIAWLAMNKWLADFAYRTEIPWWIIGVSGLAAILIAIITVSFQTISAALANPVDSLRDE